MAGVTVRAGLQIPSCSAARHLQATDANIACMLST